MITIKKELYNFEDLKDACWCGASDRIDEIDQNNWGDEFFDYVAEQLQYDEELDETALNDAIWFDLGDEFIKMKKEEEALCD